MRRGCCVVVAAVSISACGKSQAPGSGAASVATASASAPCAHAACADDFFIDARPSDCVAPGECDVRVELVATGAFHINDEYPYRFVADDRGGVDFLGKDGAGTNVFSKTAGDWRKESATTGAMTVRLKAPAPGERTIDGTFKVSVCSAQACLLEQRRVSATVVAK